MWCSLRVNNIRLAIKKVWRWLYCSDSYQDINPQLAEL